MSSDTNAMDFEEFCIYCAGNKELVSEFNRLTGHKMGVPRNGIEKAIDQACGHDPDREAFPDFLQLCKMIWDTCQKQAL